MKGTVLHIHIAPAASFEMEALDSAVLVPGRGIEGDRYYSGTGTYSHGSQTKEITLIEMEVLEALARNDPPRPEGRIQLAPHEHRRNVTTAGIQLSHLSGKRFRIGETVLVGGEINAPCKYIEELLGRPLFLPLYNRGGLNCRIERGGIIHVGDVVTDVLE